MIRIFEQGSYSLIRNTHLQRFLTLDDKTYTWTQDPTCCELLTTSRKNHKTDCVISVGKYVMYDVKNEEGLTNVNHLELETGVGSWQGYLLLSKLIGNPDKRIRIIPTHEIITSTSRLAKRKKQFAHEVSHTR